MGGSWFQFPHFFRYFFIFLKEFCPISSSFCGLEGSFQGKNGEKFFAPKICFHNFLGGGGARGGGKKSTLFFLKASLRDLLNEKNMKGGLAFEVFWTIETITQNSYVL